MKIRKKNSRKKFGAMENGYLNAFLVRKKSYFVTFEWVFMVLLPFHAKLNLRNVVKDSSIKRKVLEV